jgi:hypothetical protein
MDSDGSRSLSKSPFRGFRGRRINEQVPSVGAEFKVLKESPFNGSRGR